MKTLKLSTRIIVVALLLATSFIAAAVSYTATRFITYQHIEKTLKSDTLNKLNQIQSSTESVFNTGSVAHLNKLISSFSSDPDIVLIQIVDKRKQIIASNKPRQLSQTWRSESYPEDLVAIVAVMTNKITRMIIDKERNLIRSYISFCPTNDAIQQLNNQCGFIAYYIDIAYHYEQYTKTLQSLLLFIAISTSLMAIIVYTAINYSVTIPHSRIIEQLSRFRIGNPFKINTSGMIASEFHTLSDHLNEIINKTNEQHIDILKKEEMLRSIFQTAVDAIITIRDDGIIESFNSSAENMFGYHSSEAIGKNISILIPQGHREHHDQYLTNHKKNINNSTVIGEEREVNGLRKDGSTFPIEISISEINIEGSRHFTGIIKDITERKRIFNSLNETTNELKRSNLILQESSRLDGLTQLYNRAYFNDTLNNEINRAQRQNTPLSLILCDIDYFKRYNDTYGHLAGDQCLIQVSEVLRSVFRRSGELPARYGGEEFAVILPACEEEDALALCNSLREAILEMKIEHKQSDVSHYVTISIGLCTYHPNADAQPIRANEIIIAADKALYRSKRSGRNQTQVEKMSPTRDEKSPFT